MARDAEADELQAAIAALWDDARPRLLARVDALEAAGAGPWRSPSASRRCAEAHTLVGHARLVRPRRRRPTPRAKAETALEAGDRDALAAAVATLRADALSAARAGARDVSTGARRSTHDQRDRR